MLSHSLLWQIQHATALQAKARVNFSKAAKGRFNAVLRGLVEQDKLLNSNYGAMVICC
ncbi:hypothetical protein M2404_002782 [Rheinheimera pacifica]|uniref:hypothetical protein n=1 Tax=Rheinheimera pacifica TaxID=173990 RepID=UPI0021690713|nr:hypothetical protein [Rheinheimera pacifica]MCS4308427.1 hypothetical protein [Rheinheimera pacifica]